MDPVTGGTVRVREEDGWADVERINEKYKATSEYQNVLLLIDLILSISASTAECERGFRLLKQTKTDFRNQLHDSTCSDLMTVKMHTTDINVFDPVPAIRAWDPSNRRPQQQSTAGQLSVCQCTTSTTACDHCENSEVSLSEYTDSDRVTVMTMLSCDHVVCNRVCITECDCPV